MIILSYLLLVTTYAAFILPLPAQDPKLHFPHRYDRRQGREGVIAELKQKQDLLVREMKEIGLSLTPPALDFGETQIGIRTCIQGVLRNESKRKVTVELVRSLTRELNITMREDQNLTLSLKAVLSIEFCLIPEVFGSMEEKVFVKTNVGVGGVTMKWKVEENRFGLGPIELKLGETKEVKIHNPFSDTLNIRKVSSIEELVIRLSPNLSIPPGHTHPICTLFLPSNPSVSFTILHIHTSLGSLHISVQFFLTKYSFFISPPTVDFGIVTSPDISHSMRLTINTAFPFSSVTYISDSPVVSFKNIDAYVDRVLDAVFSPTADGVYTGNLTLTVDGLDTVTVPYRGICLFGFVRHRLADLTLRPEPILSKDLWLGADFPVPVTILSLGINSQAFRLQTVRGVNKLIAGDVGILMALSMNASMPRPNPCFLKLEFDVGVSSLPLIVDEGSFTCQIREEECKVVTKFDFGVVQIGENRQIVMNITNTGFFPLHIFASTNAMHPYVTAYALQEPGNRINLTDLAGNPSRFQALEPSSSLRLELDIAITGSSLRSLVSIHISHHTRELMLAWTTTSGDLIVNPKEIRLENVYMGRAQTVSIVFQHSFPRSIRILKVNSDVDLIKFTTHQNMIVPGAPIHVRDVTYPALRMGSVNLLLARDYSSPISPGEIRLWLSALLISHQQVKGLITFYIEETDNVVVPFSASFAPPRLILQEVDFGVVQVNTLSRRYIRVQNPSDTAISIQLLVYSGQLTTDSNITELVLAETHASPSSSSQPFYLDERLRGPIDLSPHDSIVLGPLLCRLPTPGLTHSTLYIRNYLTGFESVRLSGQGAYGELTVIREITPEDAIIVYKKADSKRIPIDLTKDVALLEQGKGKYGFTRAFLLRNTGNKPLFILNTMLEGGSCALHGVSLLSCHEVLYLHPGWLLEVTISVKPTFLSAISSIDLVLETEEEVLRVPIDVISPETYLQAVPLAKHAFIPIWTLNALITVSLGALIAFFREEYKGKRPLLQPIFTKPTCEFHFTLLPLSAPLPRRHRRKPTTTPAIVISQEPTFTEAVDLAVEPPEDEDAEEMNDEDFLDDYKAKSGLFWGFRPSTED